MTKQDMKQNICFAFSEACAKLFDSIPARYTVNQLVPSKKDWNEVLVNRSGDPGEKYYISDVELRGSGEKMIPVRKMTEIKKTVVEWLWYPFIPFGKVTLIQGDPGQGKHGLPCIWLQPVPIERNCPTSSRWILSMCCTRLQKMESEIRLNRD